MKKILFIIIIIPFVLTAIADEGMWIPILLKKYKFEDMQKKGFKLTAEDIYSINQASMKDAVVLFGRGCTGELVSNEGLLLTNHHCGYGSIQAQSTVEHDYLRNGFWAMNKSEELSNPKLSVTFLVRMEDVTTKVLDGISNKLTQEERAAKISKNIAKIKKETSEEKRYSIDIKPFYYGNEYYMFVYEIFKDVRLVGAPPSSIGKFGGDTDNWMWPRHTGDFSVFRIYANKDNQPAEYSPNNVPYKPKKFFPVSLKGVKKDDFTMVYGFPGTTQEYLPSYAIKMLTEVENPHQIKLREVRMGIMNTDMTASPKVRIQYSNKYATVSNYWKKWLGENRGLKRLNAIEKKEQFENKFQTWVNADSERKKMYGNILPEYKSVYEKLTPYTRIEAYLFEGVMTDEMVKFAGNFKDYQSWGTKSDSLLTPIFATIRVRSRDMFKDFNLTTNQKMFSLMLKMYCDSISPDYYPQIMKTWIKKYKGNWDYCVNDISNKTIFSSDLKVNSFLENFKKSGAKTIEKDPIFIFYAQIANMYNESILPFVNNYNNQVDSLNRIYMKAQMEFQPERTFYPDANLTLRITYGKVNDYSPKDGVTYDWFTTLDGIIDKDDSTIYDYDVPTRLKELWQNKDYGRYSENGVLKVCFTGSNHTTGGNSGSPVINGNGELIGLNFDRNWEGTMSDIMYDPDQCRNITLDIRYVLFIIDKFAGAGHLVNEMTIVE
ncbi:MAG: S46 family peptidase [Bacteroidia bacterium]|nr:S46 family peptidase [Bacteroidia bacterium]